MLIEISEDCLESLTTHKEYLNNVLSSYQNGNHIVMFEKRINMYKTLESLYKNDDSILRTIRNIYSMHNDNKNLLKLLKTYIKLVGANNEFCRKENSGIVCYEVPINHFPEFVKECIIISENLSDTESYITLAKRAQKETFLEIPPIVKLNYLDIPGGGRETYKVYRKHAGIKGQIVFCICDSDKSREADNFGSTASLLITQHGCLEEGEHISDIHVLNVREKENLIPPELYILHPSFHSNELLISLIGKENIFKYMKISANNIPLTGQQKEELSITNEQSNGIGKKGFSKWIDSIINTESPYIYLSEDSAEVTKCENLRFFEKLPDYLKVEHESLLHKIFDWSCSYGRMRVSL